MHSDGKGLRNNCDCRLVFLHCIQVHIAGNMEQEQQMHIVTSEPLKG